MTINNRFGPYAPTLGFGRYHLFLGAVAKEADSGTILDDEPNKLPTSLAFATKYRTKSFYLDESGGACNLDNACSRSADFVICLDEFGATRIPSLPRGLLSLVPLVPERNLAAEASFVSAPGR